MWSYVLSAIGVLGLYLAGSKKRVGWLVGFGAQGLWITYALATEQYGFCLSAFAYGWVYARNWWRARPAKRSWLDEYNRVMGTEYERAAREGP